jgi:hypothetical protein
MAGVDTATDEVRERWSVDAIHAWYAQRPWPVGCNFIPSTAINQLEMWQADTFDPETIDRELGYARRLGFNTVRVYLHDIAWHVDPDRFLRRMDAFLAISERYNIAPLFVLFDACWDPLPKAGIQRDPKPHVHNSGWVQGPSVEILKDPSRHAEMEPYVTAVLGRFGNDTRIFGWDLYNEPGNTNASSYGSLDLPNKEEKSLLFLQQVYRWARAASPQQPLTVGIWGGDWSNRETMSPLNRFMLDHSDFISFHSYQPLEEVQKRVEELQPLGRPIVCTEYMSRTTGSTFESIMPYLKEQGIGACNWGLVAGKSQTIYPWESWTRTFAEEPSEWFHDILRPDGTPFDAAEVELLRNLTGAESSAG